MENNEKMKCLKAFKEFIPYAILIVSATVVKVFMYKARTKQITRARLVFVTLSSLFIGMLSGLVCYGLGTSHWLTYLIVSGSTLSSESIVEVYLANSKSAFLRLWDRGMEYVFSIIERKKKK